MDNFLNILRIDVDRSHRVYDTRNLSLNQCSTNNRIALYYDEEVKYDRIEISFRKPDGWLSDKYGLITNTDDDGIRYAYLDVPENITSFKLNGRNGILTANIYFHYSIGENENKVSYTATAGNIRINVNYVDDSKINTNVDPGHIQNLFNLTWAVQDEFSDFKQGDIEVAKAKMDDKGNIFTEHYETVADARKKYELLDFNKLDKSEVEDQTERLNIIENTFSVSNTRLQNLESGLNSNNDITIQNKNDITALKENTVSDEEFNAAIEERKQAEINLQSQIDGIHQGSNFADMVERASDLTPAFGLAQGYQPGDRVLALNNNTVHRWNGEKFDNLGYYGSVSYTKSEIDSQHNSIKSSIANKATLINGELKLSKGNTPISTETVKVKTVNGESIWGEGNIVIPVDDVFSETSSNPVQNKLITAALSDKLSLSEGAELRRLINTKANLTDLYTKQNKLTPGANIKIVENADRTIISADAAITVKKVPYERLEEIPSFERSTNIIYLYKDVNETEYSEYLWIVDNEETGEGHFEPFGKAGLNLDNYYTKGEADIELGKKADNSYVSELEKRITSNAGKIEGKVSQAVFDDLDGEVDNLNAAMINMQTTVSQKANTADIERDYALKNNPPAAYQRALVSGENIKRLKVADGQTVDLLGEGEIALLDMSITDLGDYYRKDEANPKFALKTELFDKDYNKLNNIPDLNVYRLIEDSYSKEEVNAEIQKADISDRLTNYYIKSEVDELIQNVDISDELTNYYTKDEVDEAVAGVDVSEQLKDFPTRTEVASTYLTQTNAADIYATNDYVERVALKIPTTTSGLTDDIGFITKANLPKDLNEFTNGPGYLTSESPAFKNKQDKLVPGTNIKTINGQDILGAGDLTVITDVSKLETKTDAENKLANSKSYTDTAKQELQTSITQNTTLINALRTDLTNEVSARSSGDATTLAAAKTYTDTTIRDVIEDTEGALEAIKQIKEQIGTGESGVGGILSSINTNKTDIANVRKDLETEAGLREAADTILQESISGNTDSIKSLQTQINTEIQNRTTGDAALSERITTLNNSFETHKTSANNSLIELNNKITAEAEARFTEDQNIYGVIDNFTSGMDTKIKQVEDLVSAVDSRTQTAQKDITNHKLEADTNFAAVNRAITLKIKFKDWTTSSTSNGDYGTEPS